MKRIIYHITLCMLACASCQKSQTITAKETISKQPLTNGGKEYLIKKGNHYSEQNDPELINTAAIHASVIFDSSAIYTSVDKLNQADVNKLIGFSDCGTDHEQNSARLGWSWDGNEVLIYAYAYVNKTRIIKTLGAITLNQPISCSVTSENGNYYFRVNGYNDSIPAHCTGYTGYHYELFPYFGGDETASHDIKIIIATE